MTPVPTAVRLSAPGGIAVRWADGHDSLYPCDYLRKACPCASCRDNPPQVVSDSDPFRIVGRDPIRASKAEAVGRYAIQIHWNDGHSAGIYTFDYLRSVCPCGACAASPE